MTNQQAFAFIYNMITDESVKMNYKNATLLKECLDKLAKALIEIDNCKVPVEKITK